MPNYNFLFITSDQQHFDTIGAFNPNIKTPNLDRLCRRGTYFNRAYTVNPTCTPARASMITGKYPSQHGAWSLGTKLPENCTTIGDLLHEQNYKTSLIGKAHFQPFETCEKYPSLESMPLVWDLEYWKNFNQEFYGFDTVKLARNHTSEKFVGQHYALWMEAKGCKNWRDYFPPPVGTRDNDNNKFHWEIPEEYHYDTWIAEETNLQLEKYKENNDNFMLWASFFDPHPKYLAPEPWDTMYDDANLKAPVVDDNELTYATELHRLTQEEKPDYSKYKGEYLIHGCRSHMRDFKDADPNMRTYYSMVSLMDKYIGKILDKLEELDMDKNTIVVFTTDHGHFFGQHGLHAKGPFLFDDLIKIPMIVSCPGTIPEGKVSDAFQSTVDIPVTLLDYMGVEIPYDWTGVNQRDVWENKVDKIRDHVICEFNHERNKVNLRAYVDDHYKLVIHYNNSYGELYDLQNDPKEIHNRWSDKDYNDIKNELFVKYIFAELEKESLYMPRISPA